MVAALDTLEREGWVALARVASLRVPPPQGHVGGEGGGLKLAGFHGNQNNLAWAARVMPREGPAVRARVLRPPRPGAPATAEQPRLRRLSSHSLNSPPAQPAAVVAPTAATAAFARAPPTPAVSLSPSR